MRCWFVVGLMLAPLTTLAQAPAATPPKQGTIVWHEDIPGEWKIVHAGTATLVLRYGAKLRVVDAKTGKLRFERALDTDRMRVTANDKYMTIQKADRTTDIVDTRKGKVSWTVDADRDAGIVGDLLYHTGEKGVHVGRAPRKGKKLKHGFPIASMYSMKSGKNDARIGNRVIFTHMKMIRQTREPQIACFDLDRGKQTWSAKLPKKQYSYRTENAAGHGKVTRTYTVYDEILGWIPGPDDHVAALCEKAMPRGGKRGKGKKLPGARYLWFFTGKSGKGRKAPLNLKVAAKAGKPKLRWVSGGKLGHVLVATWHAQGQVFHGLYTPDAGLKYTFGPTTVGKVQSGSSQQLVGISGGAPGFSVYLPEGGGKTQMKWSSKDTLIRAGDKGYTVYRAGKPPKLVRLDRQGEDVESLDLPEGSWRAETHGPLTFLTDSTSNTLLLLHGKKLQLLAKWDLPTRYYSNSIRPLDEDRYRELLMRCGTKLVRFSVPK